MAERKPICDEIRDLYDRHEPYWRSYHDAMDEEDAFRDGDRYEDNEDWHNRDRRLVQIRGQETDDTIRHMIAVWFTKPRNLQARPTDKIGDPLSAEFMTSVVEQELRNPYKGFDRELYKAVDAAWTHRMGLVWLDWCPDHGQWGEIFPGEEDARRFMWDPAYHPHHPRSRWLLRTSRIHVEEARDMYKAPDLEPDRIGGRKGIGMRPDQVLLRGRGAFEQPYEDDNITLWQCWYKNDKTYAKRDKRGGRDQILEPADRYMACASGCGYRSPRQSDLNQDLPDMLEGACPTCRGNLERVDSLGEQETIYRYARGKRLVIMAPFNTGYQDKPLVDGNWPVPQARSYPILVVKAEERSGRAMGGSAVSKAWDNQTASDQLATMALQHVFSSQPLWIWPKVGLYDRDGRRFERRDDQGNDCFRDDSQQSLSPQPVQRLDGGGLDNGWPTVYQTIQNKLTQYRGVADFGLTEDSSKDIPASTVAQITKQEELPSADFVKRLRGEMGIFCGVLADYIQATYPPARLIRLNLEGTDMVLETWGQDMPGMDYEIEDTPEFTGLEKSRVEALQMLENVVMQGMQMGLPPDVIAEKITVYAEEMHFPPSTVQKFQKVMERMMMAQAQAMQEQQMAAQDQAAMQEDEAAQDIEAGVGVPGFQPSDAELEAQAMGAPQAPAV